MSIREPYILYLKYPFSKEINDMLIIILTKEYNGKYKKTVKGKINFYRKQILSDVIYYEKYIHLELYKSQTDLNIKEYTGTDILATISNIGKIFMKAQLFDLKSTESTTKHINNREDVNSIFVSSNEVVSLTKTIKKAIKKFKEDNPDIAKQLQNLNIKEINPRFKSIIEKTNANLQDNKKKKLNVNANGNGNLKQKEGNIKEIESDEDEEDNINFDMEEDNHFNDGLSELSQELEKEKETIMNISPNEDELFVNLENIHSEMDEMVSKFMSLYQEKTNM